MLGTYTNETVATAAWGLQYVSQHDTMQSSRKGNNQQEIKTSKVTESCVILMHYVVRIG